MLIYLFLKTVETAVKVIVKMLELGWLNPFQSEKFFQMPQGFPGGNPEQDPKQDPYKILTRS